MKCPKALKPLYDAWMKFSHVLGLIMSTIILTVLWIVGFGLYAITLRIIDIPSRFKEKPESYWIDIQSESHDLMQYPF